MLILAILAVLVAVGAGFLVKLALDRIETPLEITWREFLVGALIIAVLIVPLSTWVGWRVAKSGTLSFREYWNGYELETQWERTQCSRDGPCVHEYDCDPWTHIHVETSTDSKGNTTTETYPHTHYRSCPYTDEEWTFRIDTTLGAYTIADHWLPTNPEEHRWRSGKSVPDRFASGIPEFWAAAKARIDRGDPGPVTKRMTYDNYILASDRSILKQYSDQIARFKADDLLPDVARDIRDFYYADKVHFVGYAPRDPEGLQTALAWQTALMRLNAALGSELQGDLHLVIVQDNRVSAEPDAYLLALKAHWTNPGEFGDDALSKNAIVVVIGTDDGATVTWARATTGMPLGNEAMLTALRTRLIGTALTPENVIGDVRGEFYDDVDEETGESERDVRGQHGNGTLERILWGLNDPATRFQRISMTGKDADDIGGGFLYLDSEIQPSTGQRIAIAAVIFGISLPVWLAFAFIGERLPTRRRDF